MEYKHTLRPREGRTTCYRPSQPSSQHGVKEKWPVAGVKAWMDTGPGSLLIPAPSRGAQNCMQAEGGAGSQPHHSSQRIPTPPPGLCPRQGTELQRS